MSNKNCMLMIAVFCLVAIYVPSSVKGEEIDSYIGNDKKNVLQFRTINNTEANAGILSSNSKEKELIGICQLYNGTTCKKYLNNSSVFVPPNITLKKLEERLRAAYGVIKESKDMNPNCRIYALPSLCFSTLPICRTPERTNLLYFAKRASYKEGNFIQDRNPLTYGNVLKHIHEKRKKRHFEMKLKERKQFLKKSSFTYEEVFAGDISSKYPPTRESENLKRICRDECDLLENELCQKEYAIAKRHPVIGQKLPFEECASLPDNGDCSTLGVTVDVNTEQKCFWEDGAGYRGTLSFSSSGKPCLRWSWLMKEISDYPELAGQNYCRNPGNTKDRPWCFVDDSSFEKIIEYCNIQKCSDDIWFYIFLTIGTCFSLFVLYVILVIFKRSHFNGMTNIQNVTFTLGISWRAKATKFICKYS